MDSQHVLTIAQQAMALLMMICTPLLGVVLVVGLVVSVVQAITQIHESTLAFLPKLVAAIVVLVVGGPWMIGMLVDYLRRTLQSIPAMVQ